MIELIAITLAKKPKFKILYFKCESFPISIPIKNSKQRMLKGKRASLVFLIHFLSGLKKPNNTPIIRKKMYFNITSYYIPVNLKNCRFIKQITKL